MEKRCRICGGVESHLNSDGEWRCDNCCARVRMATQNELSERAEQVEKILKEIDGYKKNTN